ncbi:MAG: iron-containing alcohol dehydrogenase, partial [Luminiphilus sp.]|nr:iron-containing alcohol dehydrogenase [Luminiphilus sp.]
MTSFSYSTVPHVRVGSGLAGTLGDECEKLGVSRPLIVTDNGLVTLGLITPIAQAISAQCESLTIFDGVAADPSEAVVEAAYVVAREHNVDGVIAVGGGSSMDVAKVVSVLMVGDQSLADMYGVDQVPPGRLPLFLVPTTAGTGSEVTPVAVITTGATT